MDIKTKLKNFALMMAVTSGATTAGSAIFHALKPATEAASTGGDDAAGAAEASGTPRFGDAATTVPTYGEPPRTPYITSGSDSTNTVPTYGEPPNTPYTTSGSDSTTTSWTVGEPPTTFPTTYQSDSINTASTDPTARSAAEWEEHALGHGLPVNLFGEPQSTFLDNLAHDMISTTGFQSQNRF